MKCVVCVEVSCVEGSECVTTDIYIEDMKVKLQIMDCCFCFQSRKDQTFVCVYVCVCVCVCVCVSLTTHSRKLLKSLSNWACTVTASDMRMHHVFIIILTLTFIQAETDLNRENNQC